MNHQDEFDRTVRAWFEDDAQQSAPRHLFDAVIADTRSRRPRVSWTRRLGLSGTACVLPGASRISRLAILLGLLAALLIGLVGGALLTGGSHSALTSVHPSTGPTPPATATPTRPPVAGAVDLETLLQSPMQRQDPLAAGVTYTSSLFAPQVTFKLTAFGIKYVAGNETDWCQPADPIDPTHAPRYLHHSERAILLSWLMACINQLWIIRPASVDCGTPTEHPDAATLATAILANPRLGARDLGTIQTPGAVPATLFIGTYSGRVVEIDKDQAFDPSVNDPDHCRLILTPSDSGTFVPNSGTTDPNFELRADLSSKLIMTDVNGELVIVLVEQAGYDVTTGIEAHSRHYDGPYPPSTFLALLSGIYDVKIGP